MIQTGTKLGRFPINRSIIPHQTAAITPVYELIDGLQLISLIPSIKLLRPTAPPPPQSGIHNRQALIKESKLELGSEN